MEGGDKNSRGSVCPTNLFFCTLSRTSSSLGHSQVFTFVSQCVYTRASARDVCINVCVSYSMVTSKQPGKKRNEIYLADESSVEI